jgi:hypothetical protein
MKPFGIVLASLLLITPISFAAAPATQPSLEKENAALKARIAELEAKVVELQARIALQTPRLSVAPYAPGPYRFDLNQGRYTVSPLTPAQPALPPGWVERQFNGQPLYLVPLADQKEQPK